MSKKNKKVLLSLLMKGEDLSFDKNLLTPEQAIEIFSYFSNKNPYFFLKNILEMAELEINGMITLALAVLTSQAKEDFLIREDVVDYIKCILGGFKPPKLLEYVEYLKSKKFGRGFGSRPQKWVRDIMENWTLIDVKNFQIKHSHDFLHLIKLVHPKFIGISSKIIKKLFKNKILSPSF